MYPADAPWAHSSAECAEPLNNCRKRNRDELIVRSCSGDTKSLNNCHKHNTDELIVRSNSGDTKSLNNCHKHNTDELIVRSYSGDTNITAQPMAIAYMLFFSNIGLPTSAKLKLVKISVGRHAHNSRIAWCRAPVQIG